MRGNPSTEDEPGYRQLLHARPAHGILACLERPFHMKGGRQRFRPLARPGRSFTWPVSNRSPTLQRSARHGWLSVLSVVFHSLADSRWAG